MAGRGGIVQAQMRNFLIEPHRIETVFPGLSVYGECMARLVSTTVRLDEEDVRALKRARAAGHSASKLVRKGLRVVASRYCTGRRTPSTRLLESTDRKLGNESELFRDLEERQPKATGGRNRHDRVAHPAGTSGLIGAEAGRILIL